MKMTATLQRYILHVFCAVVIFLFLTIFLLFQSVVDEHGLPYKASQFLQPKTFLRILSGVRQKKPTPLQENIYFMEENQLMKNPEKPEFVAKLESTAKESEIFHCSFAEGEFFTYVNTDNQVVIMDAQQSFLVSTPKSDAAKIMQCDSEGRVIVSWKTQKEWSIGYVQISSNAKQNGERQELITIKQHIPYPHDTLGMIAPFTTQFSTQIAYPSCSPSCTLHLFSIDDPEKELVYPLIGDGSYHQTYADFELRFSFYDGQRKLAGYWIVEADRPYRFIVIRLEDDPNGTDPVVLLQSVHLDANRARLLSYADYDPTSQYMLFTTVPDGKNYQEVFAYSATHPTLKLLGKVEKNATVRFINSEGVYTTGDGLKSVMNEGWRGKEKKQFVKIK